MLKKSLSVLLTCLMTAMVFAGCGKSESKDTGAGADTSKDKPAVEEKVELAQGVSDTTIKIGTIGPTSGAVAVVGVPMLHGMQAYFNMVNDNGGVKGRKIELIAKDDGFKADVALQKAEELVESDKVFAIVGQLGTPGCLATIDYFKEQGIPAVYQGSGSSAFSQVKENYFPVQPNYTFEGGLLTRYSFDELKAKSIAVIYENNDLGKEGLAGVKAKLKTLSQEDALVVEVPYNPTETDFSSHIQKLSEKSPEVTIIYGTAKPAANIAVAAKKQGFKTQFLATYGLADVTLFALAQDAWNDVITAAWVADITDPSNEAAKKFVETFTKHFSGETPNAYAVAGWVAAQVFVEGLNKTEGDLTWENYIKAMESLNDYSEGLAKGITYTTDRRNGVEKMYFMKAVYTDAKNFKFEVISDFMGE